MGVRGAALATVLAQAGAAVWSVFTLVSGRVHLHIRKAHLAPAPGLAWRLLRIGLPARARCCRAA